MLGVATGTLNDSVDLDLIHKYFEETQYDPKVFPGLVLRIRNPKTSTLIFSSGKLVCTGAKSEKTAARAINSVVRRLRKGGVKIVSEPSVKVQNIVSSISLGGKVKLEEVVRRFPRTMYEPEQFPGVILRRSDPKVVFLVFSSGNLVCTGATREADVFKAVNDLRNMLEQRHLMIY